jgi:hypothetical protein
MSQPLNPPYTLIAIQVGSRAGLDDLEKNVVNIYDRIAIGTLAIPTALPLLGIESYASTEMRPRTADR